MRWRLRAAGGARADQPVLDLAVAARIRTQHQATRWPGLAVGEPRLLAGASRTELDPEQDAYNHEQQPGREQDVRGEAEDGQGHDGDEDEGDDREHGDWSPFCRHNGAHVPGCRRRLPASIGISPDLSLRRIPAASGSTPAYETRAAGPPAPESSSRSVAARVAGWDRFNGG